MQAAPTNPAPVQSSQPVDLEKGRLPQLTRPISIGDLSGEWKDAGSGISNWYSAQTGTVLPIRIVSGSKSAVAW